MRNNFIRRSYRQTAMSCRSLLTVTVFMAAMATGSLADDKPRSKHVACHSEREHVTLSGVLTFAKGTNARTERSYSYPLLKLNKPSCYRDTKMGDVPKAQDVALLPDETALHQFDDLADRRITVEGTLIHSSTTDQPPKDLLLFEATLVRKLP